MLKEIGRGRVRPGPAAIIVPILLILACATGRPVPPLAIADEGSDKPTIESVLTLDAAISEAASYFIAQLPDNTRIALLPFEAPTGRLSDYLFEEMWGRLEDSRKFIMVDRRNLARIDDEIKHQLGSGRVDDDQALSITRQYGAEILVHGHFSALGSAIGQDPAPEYRMTAYATDVEKAVSSQRAFTVNPDRLLVSLLDASLEDVVEKAVSLMAASLDSKIVIAVGRISYGTTQTVSSLSAWLKNAIIFSAQRQRGKFEVASDRESADFAIASRGLTVAAVPDSPIQAIVTGTYSPLDSGAEVVLHLVSAGSAKTVLASSQFVIPAAELERRRLSLLPDAEMSSAALDKFEARQQAVDPYSGYGNQWDFTITPDVLDGIYLEGDFMYMQLYSEKDCYFRIIHVDVYGKTQVIYPAGEMDNNFIRAGETRPIPDNFLYLMGPPFGEELILAAAYEQPFSYNRSPGAFSLSAENISRSLTVENDDLDEFNPGATARFSYTVLPRYR